MTDQRPLAVALQPTISDRVHNAIKLHIAAQGFLTVTFPGGIRTTSLTESVQARTILVRPATVGFIESRTRKCGGRLQQRTAWIWTALVHFDRQIDFDAFEDSLLHAPLRIARDESLDQQIDISLLDAVYEHPPEQEPSHGSRVTYRLQVDLTPL